jgi:hypothetical protein
VIDEIEKEGRSSEEFESSREKAENGAKVSVPRVPTIGSNRALNEWKSPQQLQTLRHLSVTSRLLSVYPSESQACGLLSNVLHECVDVCSHDAGNLYLDHAFSLLSRSTC